MRYTFLISIIIFIFAGCSKDKYTTRPQLKYESVNSKDIPRGGLLKFTFSFTDSEGDLGDDSDSRDSSVYIEKISLVCTGSDFQTKYKLPPFPTRKNQTGKIEVDFVNGIIVPGYVSVNPGCAVDSCYFRFMLQDKAHNKSDTVNSDIIVLYE